MMTAALESDHLNLAKFTKVGLETLVAESELEQEPTATRQAAGLADAGGPLPGTAASADPAPSAPQVQWPDGIHAAVAVGVPFVNAWFPPEKRGLAVGVFGAGMGGTAISALTTVKLFTNVGETGGDITPMVEQCRKGVAWVWRNAARFGLDPSKLYLCSRSSGSHISACLVTTEWEKQGLPRDILKGAVLGSGMYDLKGPRLSARSNYVKFDDAMEDALSAQRHLDKVRTPVLLVHGTLETPEFQRQTRDFAAALKQAGKPVELIVAEGFNHFEIRETFANPFGVVGRAWLAQMKLSINGN